MAIMDKSIHNFSGVAGDVNSVGTLRILCGYNNHIDEL